MTNTQPSEQARQRRVCKFGDPSCPCQDGDMCHYEGPNPWSPPSEQQQMEWAAKASLFTPERITSVVSLRKIETELAELGDLLQLAIQDGNEAEIAAIQEQIGKYLTAEQRKVDSYHGFIRNGLNLIGEIKAEEERLYGVRKALEGALERVKGVAVCVLQSLGKKRLEGSYGKRLRLHPSPVSVEITDPIQVPDQFVMVTLKIPLHFWKMLRNDIRYIGEITDNGTREFSLTKIKAALEGAQMCPECNGRKTHAFTDTVDASGFARPWGDCPRCKGTGKIPGYVPGARLIKDAVHLRCE